MSWKEIGLWYLIGFVVTASFLAFVQTPNDAKQCNREAQFQSALLSAASLSSCSYLVSSPLASRLSLPALLYRLRDADQTSAFRIAVIGPNAEGCLFAGNMGQLFQSVNLPYSIDLYTQEGFCDNGTRKPRPSANEAKALYHFVYFAAGAHFVTLDELSFWWDRTHRGAGVMGGAEYASAAFLQKTGFGGVADSVRKAGIIMEVVNTFASLRGIVVHTTHSEVQWLHRVGKFKKSVGSRRFSKTAAGFSGSWFFVRQSEATERAKAVCSRTAFRQNSMLNQTFFPLEPEPDVPIRSNGSKKRRVWKNRNW